MMVRSMYRAGLFVYMLVNKVLGGTADRGRYRSNSAFMLHIGTLIRLELMRQERTPTWLARKINCERTNVYDIFERASINTDLLFKISETLHYDFFAEYSRHLLRPDLCNSGENIDGIVG